MLRVDFWRWRRNINVYVHLLRPSFRLVQHDDTAIALAITFTLKCKQIDKHFAIVTPFPYLS